MNGLLAAAQPLPEDEAVQWTKNQALGTTGRTRNGADILRPQTLTRQVPEGRGAGIYLQGLHAPASDGGAVAAPAQPVDRVLLQHHVDVQPQHITH